MENHVVETINMTEGVMGVARKLFLFIKNKFHFRLYRFYIGYIDI